MPIFLPLRSVMRLISGFAINEKTWRLVAPATRARFAPFKFACDRVDTVHERKSDLTGEDRLNTPGTRWNMNQLDV